MYKPLCLYMIYTETHNFHQSRPSLLYKRNYLQTDHEDTYWPIFSWMYSEKQFVPAKVKLIGGKMNGLRQAGEGALCHKALNHQIISFMGEAREKIIANVPRVTKGNEGNGAIYKLWLVYMENFQPISFVILLLSIKSTLGRLGGCGRPLKSIPLPCHCCCFPSLLFLVAGTMTCLADVNQWNTKRIKTTQTSSSHNSSLCRLQPTLGWTYSEHCGVTTQE